MIPEHRLKMDGEMCKDDLLQTNSQRWSKGASPSRGCWQTQCNFSFAQIENISVLPGVV